MKSTADNSDSAAREEQLLEKSSLYQEFLAEREEILRHKWLESEKVGRDIGFERALLDWIRNHRDSWRAARRKRPIVDGMGEGRAKGGGAKKSSGSY